MRNFKEQYGPWALIAGASEGLGAAFAEALARRGLHLVLLARRQEKLEALAATLRQQYAVEVQTQALDLSDQGQLRSFVEALALPIGLLVYNAAYSPIGNFVTVPTEQLLQIVNVNVKGPLLLARLLTPPMIERGKGGILLMSSLAGSQGGPKIATYAASKAFNTILAEGLWRELQDQGVDVLASCAGAIRTPNYMQAEQSQEAPGTLDPAVVAEESLKALGQGPTTLPGWTNKLAYFFMNRLLPRKTAINIMYHNTKDLS